MIGFGLFLAVSANVVNGVWLVLIGWYLSGLVRNSRANFDLRRRLEGLTVSHLMNRQLATVPAGMTLSSLVQDRIVPSGKRFFLVDDIFGQVLGVITLRRVKSVPRRKWDAATVEDAMQRADQIVSVPPQMALVSALETMDEAQLPDVAVMEHNVVTGVLSRDDVMDYLRTRADIGL
jgi:CBS domain-containing protein